jgi:sugar phosphate isomerase/epimerase
MKSADVRVRAESRNVMNHEYASDALLSRRSLLRARGVVLAGASRLPAQAGNPQPGPGLKVAIFSKHLLFLHGEELARAAAQIGFDGIDLAVRKGGHVEPDRVKQDLPPLVATIRQHGLQVPMITTDITDEKSPYANEILSTAAELGINHYRWAQFRYTNDQPIAKQLQGFHARAARLAQLNARYRVCAMYHTHSGIDLVGAPIWDLQQILNGLDPALVGVNYDIGHATVEGGLGGWIDSFRITGPYLRGIAVKDFLWEKETRGEWQPAWKPLGQGMVRFPRFFEMVSAVQFSGPLQLHFEYPLGGAESGKNPENRQLVFDAMKRDLNQLRSYLKQAKLT